jgi:dTDP-4-amino-4,6-dideoxygalactose transaminase
VRVALGCIPRFSPSFSLPELRAATKSLVRPGDDATAVRAFEQAFGEFIGARHAVMVPSARFGFHLLLEAWGIGAQVGGHAEDEVILPAMTYFAIPGMAAAAGARPVFADIHPTAFTLDPAAVEAAITPRTRAVVPTHLFGIPADIEPILALARERGIVVIEDCAQATGARIAGRRVGAFGDAAYYTFGLTKNITTLKGAMVTTDDDRIATKVRARVATCAPTPLGALWREVLTGTAMRVATHPLVYPFAVHPAVRLGNALGKDPIHDRFGEAEYAETDVMRRYRTGGPRAAQAAVGLRQLGRIDDLNGARIRNGRYLDEHLAHIPDLLRPSWPTRSEPIFMSYVVQHPRRDRLAAALRRRGVDTTVGYMTDGPNNPLFTDFPATCPTSARSFRDLLHLPVHPNLSRRDLQHMAEAVRLAALGLAT